MTTKYENTWTTAKGTIVTVTGTLAMSKVIDCDGDKCEVDCCEKSIDVFVVGFGSQGGHIVPMTPVTSDGIRIVARVGKLALTAENVAAIKKIEAQIEASPEWQAKIEKEEAARVEYKQEYARDRKNGLCPRCHSYCYGDCAAN